MKVILSREVKGLGHHEDIVNVSEGYARNFLFPRKLAVPATGNALAELEKKRKAEEAKNEKSAEEAKELAEKISGIKLVIKGKTGSGTKLYGSITHADIADELEKQHEIKVDKRKIEVEHIKTLGEHVVPIRLHRDAVAQLNVEVVGE